MRIDEIKRLAGIEATEIRKGCWKVAASDGHALKTGTAYTDTVYMAEDADVELEVVTDKERRKAENAVKYEGKTLAEAKEMLTEEIAAYDTSANVNGFTLNGGVVWLDKATRVGLMNSTTIAKAAGEETTTLWLGEEKIVVGCDMAIGLLSRLEMYALECFNVTARHRKEVQELTDIESVEAYDVTEGYPERLVFNIDGVGNADAQGKE